MPADGKIRELAAISAEVGVLERDWASLDDRLRAARTRRDQLIAELEGPAGHAPSRSPGANGATTAPARERHADYIIETARAARAIAGEFNAQAIARLLNMANLRAVNNRLAQTRRAGFIDQVRQGYYANTSKEIQSE
jgi:hypothetical protein